MSNLESTPSQRRAALMRRAVVLLARDPPAPLGELDGLLTDACAMVLALQRVGWPIDRHDEELELLRELIDELAARRRAHERDAQASPRRTA